MIEPTTEESARLAAGLEPVQFFQLDAARFIVAKRRLAEQKADIKITDDQDGVWPGAIDHNLTGVEHLTAVLWRSRNMQKHR